MFSVLISVYYKENPLYFKESLTSVLIHQTIPPTELVIVKDGPLTKDLNDVISYFLTAYKEKIVVVELKENVGLGKALNIGLNYCKYNLVARMDSDDICCKNRFEVQLDLFNKNEDLVLTGSAINEFVTDPEITVSQRSVPIDNDSIKKYLKYRNAFNHMTVMFKKDIVQSVGSYLPMMFFEDYYLWVRLAKKNMKMINVNDVLVNVRIGNDMIGRRTGLTYAKYENKFYKAIYELGYISKIHFLIITLLRIPIRLLPKGIVKNIYKILRK